jgi:ATP-dependent Clp protease adaptor protein ClpS
MHSGWDMTTIYGGDFRMTQQRVTMNARPVNNNEAYEDGLSVKVKVKTKKPSLYKVLLLNDDFTPMEFVVYVLERVFRRSRTEANDIMLKVHNDGVGVAGVFTYEVAETKVDQVMTLARKNEHPLQCTMEREE